MSLAIDGLSSIYDAQKNSGTANKLEDTLNSDLSKATEDELMEVCKDFEAYFTEQMFKAMQKMIPESESVSSSKNHCLALFPFSFCLLSNLHCLPLADSFHFSKSFRLFLNYAERILFKFTDDPCR